MRAGYYVYRTLNINRKVSADLALIVYFPHAKCASWTVSFRYMVASARALARVSHYYSRNGVIIWVSPFDRVNATARAKSVEK